MCAYTAAIYDDQTLTNDIANRLMALDANSELFTCAHVCVEQMERVHTRVLQAPINTCEHMFAHLIGPTKNLYAACFVNAHTR